MDQKQTVLKEKIKALVQQKEYDGAAELLEAYQAEYGLDTLYFLFQSIIALELEDTSRAEEHLFSAYQLSPDRFEVLFLLGSLYEQKEDYNYALEWYRKARKVANPEQLAKVDAVPERIDGADARLRLEKKKLTIFVRQQFDQFLDDIIAGLAPHFDVSKCIVTSMNQVEPAMKEADICWFEWCDELVAYASKLAIAKTKPIVCRLHRYEVFTNVPAQVQWECVDTLIVVADHLQTLLQNTVPGIEDRVHMVTVKNGVNLDNFSLQPRTPGYDIACVGYIHSRKNPMLLLQIMAKLKRLNSRYKLHVAGQFQDPLVYMYWEHMIREMQLENNIVFDGWQDDIGMWLGDKQYLLSTSLHESFGYSIAEAMAQGVKPIVHNFPFAGQIWPEQVLFNTVDEAVAMVASNVYSSTAYRNFIEKHYSLFTQLTEIRKVLAALPSEKEAVVQVPMFQKGALKQKIDQMLGARPEHQPAQAIAEPA